MTTTVNLDFSETIWTDIPKNSNGEEDWSLACNGGNYGFGYKNVILNGEKIGELQITSSEFPYCEVTGSFTKTNTVEVEETGHIVCVSIDVYNQSYISVKDFIDLLK